MPSHPSEVRPRGGEYLTHLIADARRPRLPDNVHDVLVEARDLIAQQRDVARGDFVNDRGELCVAGAINFVATGRADLCAFDGPAWDAIVRLNVLLKDDYPLTLGEWDLFQWQDEHTKKEVLLLLDTAICNSPPPPVKLDWPL